MSSISFRWLSRSISSCESTAKRRLGEEAGTPIEEIAAQEAKQEQSEASVNKIEAKLKKNVLRSPIFGVVTRQEAKVGELVAAASPVVFLIADNDFEIKANVPEADIAKVQIGNQAQVTLDAYGRGVLFLVEVVTIDPAETIIEGVSTYKVTLLFQEEDLRVRSGMTANIDIITAKSIKVLAVPQRAVTQKGQEKFVRKIEEEKVYEIKVETGLRGSDGFVEITQGLKEGDIVITFLKGE